MNLKNVINILIQLLIFGLIVWAIIFVIGLLGLPAVFVKVIEVVAGVLLVIFLLRLLQANTF